ncbi:MAG TPA: SMP-30/gluconolactonase/LRE family protein [Gemmataceae bacterium]|nr:SMP-30/gluconolactonase/LRE family protein [Gemmataceae bacterium]
MKKPLLLLSAIAVLAAALVWLAPPTLGDQPKTFPPLKGSKIERMDPALDKLLAQDAYLQDLAEGWDWAEGPLWIKDGGFLICSDIPKNSIIKWSDADGKSVFLHPSGSEKDQPDLRESGSNGLVMAPDGQAVLMEHGDRRVTKLDLKTKKKTVLCDHTPDGKRFNSPNDGCFKSNGDLYFTDPPYGLARKDRKPGEPEFPGMEMDYSGVYRLSKDGKVTLLTKEMTKPNGIAFSPDEKTLYVSNSDPKMAVWMAWDVKDDGTLGKSRVFYDATEFKKDLDEGHRGLPDGMKLDKDGNIFGTGPGGVLVFTPDAKLLGVVATGVRTSNCNWGDDGSTLYITANDHLTRIKTKTIGNGWAK